MKKIFKLVLVTILFTGLWSCTDEQDLKIVQPVGSFSITTPESSTAIVLTPELETNPALTLAWGKADFTTQTAINYTVEMALTGTEFANPIAAGSTNNTNITWNVADFNSAVVAAGLTPFTQGSVDIRIKASAAGQDLFSNVINVLVTPYSTDLPQLAVPGNHQGWNPPTAPHIASSGYGLTDYEGYIWLDGGHKFVGPDGAGNYNWGNTDWGDDGSFSGVLVETGESDCSATAGYYRVQANTTTLTYSETPTNWGVVGYATTGSDAGWNNSTPLTYNQTTKKWEGVITMSVGEFKFRANNAWTINLGGDSDADDSMNYDGPNLSISTAGVYNVVLDLSSPRKYTYSVTAQ